MLFADRARFALFLLAAISYAGLSAGSRQASSVEFPDIVDGLGQLAKAYSGHVWYCAALSCHQLDPHNYTVTHLQELDIVPWTTPWTRYDSPTAVLQPRTVADVQSALSFSKEYGLRLAVKSGGHSVNIAAMVPGGVTLDMGLMTETKVDKEKQTVTVQIGVKAGAIYAAAFSVGCYVPLGACAHVGQGITLHGGFGNAARGRGLTSDNVLRMQVVLADGSVVWASEEENQELFWGLRGAGSLFGVVTEITYKMFSLEPTTGGVLVFDDDDQHVAMVESIKFMRDVGFYDEALDMTCFFESNATYAVPDERVVPVLTCVYIFHDGRSAQSQEQFFSPLLKLSTLSFSSIGTFDYRGALDGPKGWCGAMVSHPTLQAYWLNGGVAMKELDERFINDLVSAALKVPISSKEPLSMMMWQLQGGRVSSSEAPVGSVLSELAWNGFISWIHVDATATFLAAAHDVRQKLKHSMTYVYGNQQTAIDPQYGIDLVATVGGIHNLHRLCDLKNAVDPHDMFTRHHFPGLLAATCRSYADESVEES